MSEFDNLIVGATPEGTLVAFENLGHDVIENPAEDDGFEGDFAEDPREQERAFYAKLRSGVMPIRHHRKYMSQGGGCADTLDQTMRELFTDPVNGVNRGALEVTAEKNGLWNPRWASLNNGMVRMNLANRLRAKARRGEDIFLFDERGNLLDEGRFGIAPTTLNRLNAEREAEAKRKEEAAAKAELAAKHRAERDAILEARQKSNKPPQARIEQKLTEKRVGKKTAAA